MDHSRTHDSTVDGGPGWNDSPSVVVPGPGVILGGRFQLREELGGGASGTVYAALDTSVGQEVAVKVLHNRVVDSRTRERLRREVRASRPGHPNLANVYDLHEATGRVFLSMELVEGSSLRSSLAETEPLDPEQAIRIASQIAAALSHLHGRGLVHRDVKPANILVTVHGDAKLCDMGLARPLEAGMTVTESEMVVGTPAFMAPEQAMGAELTGASDIYSLGLTLYKALTGEVPLSESTALATLSRRQRERPPPVRRLRSDCPRWLSRLLRWMLAPLPGDRPSAQKVQKILIARKLMPRPTRRQLVAGAIVMCCAVALAASFHLLRHQPTVRVEVGRTDIIGRDMAGEVTWQRSFEIPVHEEKRADLDGDGSEEVILNLEVAGATDARSSNAPGPEIWIFDKRGKVQSRFVPEDRLVWQFPYDMELALSLALVDIEHDQIPEVVAVLKHRNFFPAAIFVYWADSNSWEQVISHPGHIYAVGPTPRDSKPGLRFLATNNRLSVLPFVGEITVGKDVALRAAGTFLAAPPFGGIGSSGRFGLKDYVPASSTLGGLVASDGGLRNLADGGIGITGVVGNQIAYLDRFFNPVPGPNEGADLIVDRRHFMGVLGQFQPVSQPTAPEDVLDLRNTFVSRFVRLTEEDPYRLILDLKTARALARAGDLDSARNILGQTTAELPSPDAIYRLAHLEAIAENWGEAREMLYELTSGVLGSTRASFDGPHLLLRVSTEIRDQEGVDAAIARLSRMGGSVGQTQVRAVLNARVRLWWDELQPQDLSARSWSYAPAGEAVACLARWRLGRNSGDDAGAMLEFIQRNPDAATEGRLARAASLIGNGQDRQAIVELSLVIEEMEYLAREDFSSHQLLDLARALRVVALLSAGEGVQARREAEAQVDELRQDLLPGILVREVLEDLP